MRYGTIVVLVATALVATSVAGYCQTGRAAGMGFTGVGLADDAAAWAFNPAGLPSMNIAANEDSDIACQAVLGTDFSSTRGFDQDVFSLGILDGDQGFGVGRRHSDDARSTGIGAGYGRMLSERWSWGISIVIADVPGNSETLLNGGLMYRWVPSWSNGQDAKFGILISDITDEMGVPGRDGRMWHMGASTYVGNSVLLALDVVDLTDETGVPGVQKSGTMFNVGAEVAVADWLDLRIGAQDGDLTYGAGVSFGNGWRLDAGLCELDFGGAFTPDMNVVSLSKDF